MGAYVASKGALVGLTRVLAHELGHEGILVNCLSLGAIVVEKEGRDPAKDERVINWQSVRRRLVPQDLLAPMCLFLSSAGGGITGQMLRVEGGVTHPMTSAVAQKKRLDIDAGNPDFQKGI
jgi:NAD(P)-dependent dehydrogenase (short-subunit alcohol dehydrogenase family)